MARLSLFARLGQAALAWFAAGAALAQPAAPANGATVIRNVNLITLDERGVLAGASVVTRHGRIEAILVAGQAAPAGATVIDGANHYLIPGLIDAHVHYQSDRQLTNFLRYGVTTVFSLGTRGSLGPIMAARRSLANGTLVGAHLYATGPAIANHRTLETPAEVEPFLAEMQSDGFEFVKVYNEIPQDVFDAVVAGAHRRGMGVFGHMPRRFPPEYSIAHGLNVLAHMEELFFTTFQGPRDRDLAGTRADWTPDYARIDPILDLIAANNVAIIPNLVAPFTFQKMWEDSDELLSSAEAAYLDSATRDQWRSEIQRSIGRLPPQWSMREQIKYPLIRLLTYRASQKGILLLAGSDSPIRGVYPGRSLHQELRLLVAAGLTPEQALRTATVNGGIATRRYVDPHACIGVIRVGCEADLALLSANPLDDIRNSETIVGVMDDGRWHSRAELDVLARPID
jgi:hypothetical protein